MSVSFARRMGTVHRSFIREILKVTADPSIISFAGGLPNPELFPVKAMEEAAVRVFREQGASSLQYSTTEGDPNLRGFIAQRYKDKKGLVIDPDDIIITTGSQQCLDMIAKVFIDQGDKVLIERPGYLGAIQAFSIFEPEFVTVALRDDGPDMDELEQVLSGGGIKLFYAVPNFQNPSGLSYGGEKRKQVVDLLADKGVMFIEDDPYGELRFMGLDQPTLYGLSGGRTLLLGSFSKIAAPGFRIGWIVAKGEMRDKLVIAKQASDLHTSTLAQRIMADYVQNNDIDEHIEKIRERYGRQRDVMVRMIREHFPAGVRCSEPEGGMFLWVTLPEGFSSMDLFDMAIKEKVAFVPGRPFYVDGSGENTLRLNFSNSSEERIEDGIKRLGRCLQGFLK